MFIRGFLIPLAFIVFFLVISLPGFAQNDSWKQEVIYFILVDRFFDGNQSNNLQVDPADPKGYHGGDLDGILEKLDYLENLGVTALWLSPVQKNRPVPFFGQQPYHGYWIWDFFSVDPHFGSPETLKKLSRELKKRRMKLLLDVVVNHAGYDAPLEKNSAYLFHQTPNIFDWNDPFERKNNRLFGLPDFASETSVVKYFFRAVGKYLVREFSPDGFRLDAVRHVPNDFWSSFNHGLKSFAGKEFFLLGEQLDGDPEVIAETWKNGKFTSLFDYPLYYSLCDVIARKGSCKALALRFAADEKYPDPNSIATFLDNHDMDRFLTTCSGDLNRLRLALSLLFSIRGIPVLYYGDETGMSGEHEKNVENRKSMNFSGNQELRNEVCKLISLRKARSSLTKGEQIHLLVNDSVFAFARVDSEEVSIGILNNSTDGKFLEIPIKGLGISSQRLTDALQGVEGQIRDGSLKCELPEESFLLFFPDCHNRGFLRQYEKNARHQRENPWLKSRSRKVFTVKNVDLLPGQTIHAIGSIPELGDWDSQLAPQMVSSGSTHSVAIDIPARSVFEWKCLIKGKKITWQKGTNQFVDTTNETPQDYLRSWGE